MKENKYIIKPESIPHLRIKETYYSLGKVLSYKLRISDAIANFTIAENLVTKVYESKNILPVGKIHNLMKEAYIKELGQRNKSNLDLALNHANTSLEIYHQIFGSEANNYYIAKANASVGDVLVEKKDYEAAEKCFHKAQTIVGFIVGENHPAITTFNSLLIEVYGYSENPEKKNRVLLIAEKNLSIAKNFYGDESIYTLKHELSIATNSITSFKIPEAQDHVARMRVIV